MPTPTIDVGPDRRSGFVDRLRRLLLRVDAGATKANSKETTIDRARYGGFVYMTGFFFSLVDGYVHVRLHEMPPSPPTPNPTPTPPFCSSSFISPIPPLHLSR